MSNILPCRSLCCGALAHEYDESRFKLIEVGPERFAIVHTKDDE